MQPIPQITSYKRGETHYSDINVLDQDISKKGPFVFLSLLPAEYDVKDLSQIKDKKAHYFDSQHFPFSLIVQTLSLEDKSYVYFTPYSHDAPKNIKADEKVYVVSWETFKKHQYPLNSQEHLDVWNEDFNEVILNCCGDMQQLKQPREVLYQATRVAAEKGFFIEGHYHCLDTNMTEKMIQGQQCFAYNNAEDISSLIEGLDNPNYETVLEVVDEGCLTIAEKHIQEGLTPAVLVMASPIGPGGGVKVGDGSQEESIYRQTNISRAMKSKHLPQDFYPINDLKAIYTPFVQVFRKPERNLQNANECTSFAYRKPFPVSMITCAAIPLKRRTMETSDFKELTYGKLELIIALASVEKHDSLVLGAFGCGAFNNPPQKIALWMRQILESPKYLGRFKKVSIAIIYNQELLSTFKDSFAKFGFKKRFEQKNTAIYASMLNPDKELQKKEMRKFRQDIFAETKLAIKEGFCVEGESTQLDSALTQKMLQGQRCFTYEEFKSVKFPGISGATEFEIVEEDILTAAENCLKAKFNPAVVNTANVEAPGKDTEKGFASQENAFFYRTNCLEALNLEKLPQGTYPIKDPKAIYTPFVLNL